MKDVVETRGKNKAKMPWFKCYPDAWVRKTRTLSLEARAVYFDCLCLLYETEKPIAQDDKWMAHYLHTSTRLWRSIRDELVMGGYLRETPAGLVDERALQEIENRAATNRERTKREFSEKPKQINKTEARNQHHIERRREEEKKENPESISHTEQESPRVGEVAVGHGVFVNCETIRHAKFTISIPAIECLTLGQFPRDEIKAKAQGHALQWAAELEAGKRPETVLPAKIANFLLASLSGEATRQQCADVRKTRAENGPKAFAKESDRERRAKIFEKLEREGRI
jgi:uncharacterized protein YdaU (DUF1376 family)